MSSKRSQHELKRLVEQAVTDVSNLPRPGLWFCVNQVEVTGRPPQQFKIWATLHFLLEGSPFCCGEPGCHLPTGKVGSKKVGDHLRRAMGLHHDVTAIFENVGVHYHEGIIFTVTATKSNSTDSAQS